MYGIQFPASSAIKNMYKNQVEMEYKYTINLKLTQQFAGANSAVRAMGTEANARSRWKTNRPMGIETIINYCVIDQ